MYLIGYDIGSSTIKAALIEAESRQVVGVAQYPEQEMDMISRQRGWAEQQPEVWWQHFCIVTQRLLDQTQTPSTDIQGIGIAYQMHGLVLIDKDQQVLRPSIIWCDSRAVPIGQEAFQTMGENYCLGQLLNSPGNFTAAKLKWVKDNEPEIYEKADKLLLPGDFIAMKLTGEAHTTISGLTEGIFWNFQEREIDRSLLRHWGLREDLLAPIVPTFSIQGRVSRKAAERTGLAIGTPVTYRAGDQPNNALALNVLHPGEIAATSGTSGVVYGIVDRPVYDPQSRVNAFAHVNYEQAHNRIGVLLCLNGAGIQYSWIKHQIARGSHTYDDMERMASTVPVGSNGLCVIPFGNGAERMLENREPNAHFFNMQFNRHTRGHIYRAALEGVAFSFVYGINILQQMHLNVDVIRVANDNMFQSKTFSTTLATLLGSQIEVVNTTGAIGAAKAAGVAAGIYASVEEAMADVEADTIFEPKSQTAETEQAYQYWLSRLQLGLEGPQPSAGNSTIQAEQIQMLKKKIRDSHASSNQLLKQVDASQDFLSSLQTQLSELDPQKIEAGDLERIRQRIAHELQAQQEADSTQQSFDHLHQTFFATLIRQFPDLSRQELKICALLRQKLRTKEIAQRMHLSVRGVETSRYRLRKKLGLAKGASLSTYLSQVDVYLT